RLVADRERALHAVRVARAADVDAHARIAVPREVAVMHRVARRVDVALAVRNHLDDGRHPLGGGDVGKPELHGKTQAVGDRYPAVVGLGELVREARDRLQCPVPGSSLRKAWILLQWMSVSLHARARAGVSPPRRRASFTWHSASRKEFPTF